MVPRRIGVQQHSGAGNADHFVQSSDVESKWIDADQSRRIEFDLRFTDDHRPQGVHVIRVDFAADGRLRIPQGVGHLDRLTHEEQFAIACGIDFEGGPVHVGWFTVIDPPAVGKRAVRSILGKLLEVDLQLDGGIILVARFLGQVQHTIHALEHRDHDRSHDPAARADHDLDRDELLVEADESREIATKEGQRFQGITGEILEGGGFRFLGVGHAGECTTDSE